MSGEAAELEKVEEILANPSGHSTLFSGSALEIHVSKLPNLNNLLIDLATQQLAKELSDWANTCSFTCTCQLQWPENSEITASSDYP